MAVAQHGGPRRLTAYPAGVPDTTAQQVKGRDGRLVLAVAVAVYLGSVAVARSAFDVDLWRVLGVPSWAYAFLDAQNLTSAAECARLGYDVLLDNPCDPLDRPLNYPRVWLVLAPLGVTQSWTPALGVAIGLAFAASVWTLFGRLSARQGLLVALAVCSPSVMYGVERGQVDLAVFVLVAAAVVAWRAGRVPHVLGPTLVLAAAIAKLFPAAGLGAFLLLGCRRAALTAVGAMVAFGVYVAVTVDDVVAIAQVYPQGDHVSFGARILVSDLATRLGFDGWTRLGPLPRQVLAAAPLGVAVVAGWLAWARWPLLERATSAPAAWDWRRLAFHLGALVYVGAFATANSADYRLVFLLLCLPQLLAWGEEADGSHRRLATAGAVLVCVQLWLGPAAWTWSVLTRASPDEVWSWLVASALTTWLAASARACLDPTRRAPHRTGSR